MKPILTVLAVIALSCAVATAGDKKPAGDKPHHSAEEIFKKIDTSADGKITLDEFKAGPRGQKDPAKAEEMFKKLDANADGSLSLDEFKAHGHGKAGDHKKHGDK